MTFVIFRFLVYFHRIPWNFNILRSISKPNSQWGPALEQHRIVKCKDIGIQVHTLQIDQNGIVNEIGSNGAINSTYM